MGGVPPSASPSSSSDRWPPVDCRFALPGSRPSLPRMDLSAPRPNHAPQPAPQLAPGLRVVRRGRDHLQVGLYDGRRVLLARTETVERTLARLLERAPLEEDPATCSVLDRLERHGCLVWRDQDRRPVGRVAVLGQLDRAGLPDLGELLGAGRVVLTSRWSDADVVVVLSSGELRPGPAGPVAAQPRQPCRRTPGGRGCRRGPVRRTRSDRVLTLHRRSPERARPRPCRGHHPLRQGHRAPSARRCARPRRPGGGHGCPRSGGP